MTSPALTPWYARRAFHWACGIGLLLAALAQGVVAIAWRENDFSWHLDAGAAFLAGKPYPSGGLYPLPRLLLDAGAASLNYYLVRSLFYLASLCALAATLVAWRRMADPLDALPGPRQLGAAALTLGILFPIVLRDLDDCGLQLLLLALLTAGAYAWCRGWGAVSGLALAAGAVYKATPLLFLPFLLWKRQWKTAFFMALWIGLLCIAPATYLGWEGMLSAHAQWWQGTAHLAQHMPEAYPSAPGMEEPKPQNLSLRALLARYVESYPPGHPLHLEHPWFLQFGNLPPTDAKRVVNGMLLLSGVGVAWLFRRSWRTPEGRRDMPTEWAVTCLFCALLSPICWKQHLVLAIPVVFLVSRRLVALPGVASRDKLALIAAAAVILLSRHGIVGRDNSILLLSYKVDTLAFLLLAWLAVRLSKQRMATAAQRTVDCSHPRKAAA